MVVTSLDPARPFSEPGNTTLVNAHGCGLIVPRALAPGIAVRLEIVSAKRHTTAHVSEVVPLGGDPETWLVGLELDIPGNFWGIDYAPSDWKVDEPKIDERKMDEQKMGEQKKGRQKIVDGPSPAAGQPGLDPGAAAAMPARSHLRPHRWRLTDISAGACYLEAAAPFSADTPVLLSIRVLDTEYLLEGVVRVSHAQTGMGIEFTRAQGHDQRARVAELIAHLMDSREVPRIFVGWKEDRKGPERRQACGGRILRPARRRKPNRPTRFWSSFARERRCPWSSFRKPCERSASRCSDTLHGAPGVPARPPWRCTSLHRKTAHEMTTRRGQAIAYAEAFFLPTPSARRENREIATEGRPPVCARLWHSRSRKWQRPAPLGLGREKNEPLPHVLAGHDSRRSGDVRM